jgi:DNA-binding MarR family transcriptional regulator
MEKKGLVCRNGVPGDARKKELVLTEQGVLVQETVLDRLDALENMVNDTLSDQERTLWMSCIHKIEARLKEAEND